MNIGKKVHFNALQLVVFSLGVLLTLALVGYLVFQISRLEGKPPQLEVTSEYRPELPDYTYRVSIKNNGEEAANSIAVKMTLYQDGKAKESGVISDNYLPIQAEQVGWISFGTKRKPTDSLVVSSITYIRP